MSPKTRQIAFLVALALLEGAWLLWFLAEPLPNAGNVGSTVSRGLLLASALPEVIPGMTFADSHLGKALDHLRHVENLADRLPIVLAASLIALAATGLGSLVLRILGLVGALRPAERLPLAFLLGTVGLGVATLGIGRLGGLSPWPIRIGLGFLAVAGAASARIVKPPGDPADASPDGRRWPAILAFGAVAGPFLAIMALGSMLPTGEFDALAYHLQGPKEAFLAGRLAFLPHNVYANMPAGVEMGHLLGMEVLNDWWRGALVGQLLVMLHAPAAAAMIARTASRWGSPRAGWFAAVAYLTTPWIVAVAVTPYVEGPLCALHAALLWAVARAWTEPQPRARVGLWAVVGLLAGGAFGCKYPALLSAVVPAGVLAIVAAGRSRSLPTALAFAAGLALTAGPWVAKNFADTGNPVYPLGYSVFGGRHWNPELDAKWSAAHGRKPITAGALGEGLLGIAGRSDWQSPLFVALAPLAFLRRGPRRLCLALLAYSAYFFATWWLLTHRLERFWLPTLPALAILTGLGADWSGGRAWRGLLVAILAVATLGNLTLASTELTGPNRWTEPLDRLRDETFAASTPSLARLDAALPAGSRVLLVGVASVFPLRHEIVYNTVFNDETIEVIARGRTPSEISGELARRGLTHLYIDWAEVARYRSPGNYGFTPFVTPDLFARLVRGGVLHPPSKIGPRQDLYRVRMKSEEEGRSARVSPGLQGSEETAMATVIEAGTFPATEPTYTADQFMKLDLGDGNFELVRGKIIRMPPPNYVHGLICLNVGFLLCEYGRRTGHGHAASNDSAVGISTDTVRGADVCYYSEARWPRAQIGQGLPPVPPDLVVEVYSPSDRAGKVLEKVGDYLRAGVLMAWVLHPTRKNLTIYRQDDPTPIVLGEADFVEDLPELPGFRCRVAEFFA